MTTITSASRLGVSMFEETEPVEAFPGQSVQDRQVILRAVYRQVLGNTYIMASERTSVPESQFTMGEINVREFVRALGKSSLYRDRFFDAVPRYRFIELNFKHFLGRTPRDQAEIRMHSDIMDTQGYNAEIDSYLDSDEYLDNFGESVAPYIRGYKTRSGMNMTEFTHMFAIQRGCATSDLIRGSVTGKTPVLNDSVLANKPIPVVAPSAGAVGNGYSFKEPEGTARTRLGTGAGMDGKMYRIEVTGYSTPSRYNSFPKIRRSNAVYYVPYSQLNQEYQRIHANNGVIASITPC